MSVPLSRSLRSIALTSGAGVIASVALAVTVGGPASVLLVVVGPLMAVALVTDRLLERRESARSELAEILKDAHSYPSSEAWLKAIPVAVTWWQAHLAPPTQRRVRLGTRTLRARDVVAGSGKQRVRPPVAIDLEGGLELSGPPEVVSLVERGLRVNRARAYGPLEAVPPVRARDALGETSSLRWLLEIDARGCGRLIDRLAQEPPCEGIDVDLLGPEHDDRMRQLEAPERVLTPRDLDLVRHGPHALVSGVTGSGKTEFLLAWMGDLARSALPATLAFVVIDFKGGGSFGRLAGLPHVRHLVSDLDPVGLDTARLGLGALVIRREKLLADYRVPDFAQLPESLGQPRVIVVVDEYRALVEVVPGFATLLHDLAARGRALGIHLVLATQRFASISSDALTSNISLRVVFRAGDRAESLALLGVPGAHDGRLTPGQALVARSGEIHTLRFAMLHALAPGQLDHSGVTPLWLEPQSARPTLLESRGVRRVTETSIALGLRDDHQALERTLIEWNPAADGVLVTTGADVQFRREVCALVVEQCPSALVLAGDAVEAWDTLETCGDLAGLLIPDVDSLVARLPSAWREDFLDRILVQAHQLIDRGCPVFVGVAGQGRVASVFEKLQTTQLVVTSAANGIVDIRGCSTQLFAPTTPSSPEPHDAAHTPRKPRRDIRDIIAGSSGEVVVVTSVPARWADFTGPGIRISPVDVYISESYSTQRTRPVLVVLDGCTAAEVRAMRLTHRALPPPQPGTLVAVDEHGNYERIGFGLNDRANLANGSPATEDVKVKLTHDEADISQRDGSHLGEGV